jgi:hypothetical protein
MEGRYYNDKDQGSSSTQSFQGKADTVSSPQHAHLP